MEFSVKGWCILYCGRFITLMIWSTLTLHRARDRVLSRVGVWWWHNRAGRRTPSPSSRRSSWSTSHWASGRRCRGRGCRLLSRGHTGVWMSTLSRRCTGAQRVPKFLRVRGMYTTRPWVVVEKQILHAGGETRCVRQCTQYPRMWKSINTSMCVRATLEQGRGAEGKWKIEKLSVSKWKVDFCKTIF